MPAPAAPVAFVCNNQNRQSSNHSVQVSCFVVRHPTVHHKNAPLTPPGAAASAMAPTQHALALACRRASSAPRLRQVVMVVVVIESAIEDRWRIPLKSATMSAIGRKMEEEGGKTPCCNVYVQMAGLVRAGPFLTWQEGESGVRPCPGQRLEVLAHRPISRREGVLVAPIWNMGGDCHLCEPTSKENEECASTLTQGRKRKEEGRRRGQ